MSKEFLGKKEREGLEESVFGDPQRRLFPILNQKDVELATEVVDLVDNKEEVRARIIEIISEKGLNIPEAWQQWQPKAASMSAVFDAGIPENAEPRIENDPVLGEVIIKTGKVFEAGQYNDKKFEITPEEMLAAVKNFKPADINIEHAPSFLDGKLGKVRAIQVDKNGWDLNAEVAVPVLLDKLNNSRPIKVSAEWNRGAKNFEKMAYVKNPRVADAAIYAAFTINESNKDDKTKKFLKKWFEDRMSIFAAVPDTEKTYGGQSLMQCVHNETSRAGAICTPDTGTAKAHSAPEQAIIQSLHDLAIDGGAKCQFIEEGVVGGCCSYPSYFSNPDQSSGKPKKEGKIMGKIAEFKKQVTNLLSGLSDDEIAKLGDNPDATDINEASKKPADAVSPAPAPAPAPSPAESNPASTQVEPEKAKVAGMSEAEKEELKTLRAKVASLSQTTEAMKKEKLASDASTFARDMVDSERALPAEVPFIVANFMQVSADDESNAVKVKFTVGTDEIEGSRLDAFKALYAARRPNNLTKETLAAFGTGVLRDQDAPDQALEESKARKSAEEFADQQNRRRTVSKDTKK